MAIDYSKFIGSSNTNKKRKSKINYSKFISPVKKTEQKPQPSVNLFVDKPIPILEPTPPTVTPPLKEAKIDFTKVPGQEKNLFVDLPFDYKKGKKVKKVDSKGRAYNTIDTPGLGGGAYYGTMADRPPTTPRTTYGGVETKKGYERDDIVSLFLGGVNESPENIKLRQSGSLIERFLDTPVQEIPKERRQEGKYSKELEIYNKYKDNKISRAEAILELKRWEFEQELKADDAQELAKRTATGLAELGKNFITDSLGGAIKVGLDAWNKLNQKNKEQKLEIHNRGVRKSGFGLVGSPNKEYSSVEEMEMDAPIIRALNTETGKNTIKFVAQNTSNLPIRAVAAAQSIGDKTYSEAYSALLAKRENPDNNFFEKIIFDLQDSGTQTAIGVLLTLGTTALTRSPILGKTVGGSYWTAVSANEQLEERGQVTTATPIAIDVALDSVLGASIGSLFKKGSQGIVKDFTKNFIIEGGTENIQSILKFTDEYVNAKSKTEKNEITAQFKNYVVGGGLLTELIVGGLAGGTIGAIAGGTVNSSDIGVINKDLKKIDDKLDEVKQEPQSEEKEIIVDRLQDTKQRIEQVIGKQEQRPQIDYSKVINSEQDKEVERLSKIWEEANKGKDIPSKVPAKEEQLTTKFLEYAKGKTTLSRQEIENFARRPELKKGEADLLNAKIQEFEGDKISAQDFADSIRGDLLELKPVKVQGNQYQGVTIDSRQFGPGETAVGKVRNNYEEVVFESPITTNGSSHFPNSKNYFAHARGDEVVESGKKVWREQEIQSDLLQKENLDRLIKEKGERIDYYKGIGAKDDVIARAEEVSSETNKLSPFTNDRFGERIMRERIREKTSKGYEKYRLPTGETIGKIEGFTEEGWTINNQNPAGIDDLKVGIEIFQTQGDLGAISEDAGWIITDILGDGRFKAVPKEQIDNYMILEETTMNQVIKNIKESGHRAQETFDLTGKSNPQAKRYEKWGKFLKNKYSGKKVTDPQGNTWVEIDLTKDLATQPVEAFKITEKGIKYDKTPAEVKADLHKIFGREIPFAIFDDSSTFNNPDAIGEVSDNTIKVLRTNSKLSDLVAKHEAWHYFKRALATPEALQEANAIEAEMLKMFPKRVQYLRENGYPDINDKQMAEEIVADEFARYYRTGNTLTEKISLFFDKVIQKLELVFKHRTDLLKYFSNIKKKLGVTRQFSSKSFASKISQRMLDKARSMTKEEFIASELKRKAERPTTKKVPREQLPVKDTAGKQKVSRLEARVKTTLDNLSQEQVGELGLATYEEMNKAEQIKLATEYVANNEEEAIDVLLGKKQAPKGLLRNSIFIALQQSASESNNADLALKLASLESTRLGQEISILTEITEFNPVSALNRLIKIYEKTLTKRTGQTKTAIKDRAIKTAKIQIKKASPTKDDWNSFIDKIKC